MSKLASMVIYEDSLEESGNPTTKNNNSSGKQSRKNRNQYDEMAMILKEQ